MKKFLTFVLVLAMVLSVSSFAMAADVPVTTEAELKTAVQSDNNITLGGNIALSGTLTIPAGVNVTLNLGGYTLSFTTDFAGTSALIVNRGTLTIEGPGKISNTANNPDTDWNPEGFPTYANNTITNYGMLTVNGGTIENKSPAGGATYSIDNSSNGVNATLVINGGLITCENNTAIRQHVNSVNYTNTITINGGTIEGTRAIWIHLTQSDGTKTAKNVTLNVTGGTLTPTDESTNRAIQVYSYGESFAGTTINISGGNLEGRVMLTNISEGKTPVGVPKVSISGGKIEKVEDASGILSEIITGGSFTEDPSALLAADYVVSKDANGNYVPAEATEVTVPSDADAEVNPVNGGIVKITKDQVNDLTGGKSLVVKTANGMKFTFSKDLLSGLLSDGGSYVAIKIKEIEQTELNEAQQNAIKSTDAKLVFTAEIYVDGEYVGDKLNGNKVQVYIPVGAVDLDTTQPSPNLDGYSLVYISDDGKLEIIANAEAGAYEIKADLPHFSEYAVIKTEDANKIIANQKTPATSSSGGGYYYVGVRYNGGNSFSTDRSDVPVAVLIDGQPVSFTGNGSNFVVDCINPGASRITIVWNTIKVEAGFTPDANAYCAQAVIPKTGGMSIWAAIAQFLGF